MVAVAEADSHRVSSAGRLAQSLLAIVIGVAAMLVVLNTTILSSYGSPAIDLSINLTAAHALRDGENPYGVTTLRERAEALGGPTELIYGQLFTSYIQPPTSAMSLLPLTTLPWRDATRVYLFFNLAVLIAAVALTLYTLRPRMSLPWLFAGSGLIVAAFSQTAASFSLGQVDPTLLLLFAIGYWAYRSDRPAVAGIAIAIAAAIKLIPGFILLYFLWKREYKAVAWGAATGLVLLAVSWAYVGTDVYRTYLEDTLPALSKGSTHYSNASFGAVNARAHTPEVIIGLPELQYLSEVPGSTSLRVASYALLASGLIFLAAVIPMRKEEKASAIGDCPSTPDAKRDTSFLEYYLVVAVALIVSSVTWEFYTIWLLPVFLAVFLAPERVLPAGWMGWVVVGVMLAVLVALNYPGDLYIFGPNPWFFHPEWVPGQWVEDRVGLYHKHLDAVILLRLPALCVLAGTLAGLILLDRRRSATTTPASDENTTPS